MKKHSEKTEDARPKREQRKRKKARERASGGTRKSAALSRPVSKRELARLARARDFGTNFRRGSRKFSRTGGGNRKLVRGFSAIVRTSTKRKRLGKPKSVKRQLSSAKGEKKVYDCSKKGENHEPYQVDLENTEGYVSKSEGVYIGDALHASRHYPSRHP